jgi:hypothetical protein
LGGDRANLDQEKWGRAGTSGGTSATETDGKQAEKNPESEGDAGACGDSRGGTRTHDPGIMRIAAPGTAGRSSLRLTAGRCWKPPETARPYCQVILPPPAPVGRLPVPCPATPREAMDSPPREGPAHPGRSAGGAAAARGRRLPPLPARRNEETLYRAAAEERRCGRGKPFGIK